MEEKDRLFGPEHKSRGKPVFLYNEDGDGFSKIKGPKGLLSIPGLPKSKPGKSLLLQSGENFFEPTDPFEKAKGYLSKKVLEAKFRRETGLEPQDAIIVTRIPSWKANKVGYDIRTVEQIWKEIDDLARGITS